MTVDDVKSTLPLTETGWVYLDLYNNAISPEDFVSRFDGATLAHDSLYNHPNATSGWKSQFDEWKNQGIIS